MSDFLVTEYDEQVGEAKDSKKLEDHHDHDHDDEFVITFFEEDEPKVDELPFEMTFEDPEVIMFDEGEELPKMHEVDEILMGPEDHEAMGFKLPGAEDFVLDQEEDEPEPEPEPETDWVKDRDPKHFMQYILEAYPKGIPKHDGTTTLGCERAIKYLTKLNKEISEALRADKDDELDIDTLENVRVKILKDITTLKEHAKNINKKRKSASEDMDVKVASMNKEATTAKLYQTMTPFERAITGIITNAVVSGGKSMEDIYEFLKKKYKFTEREELAIMQILMDMGHPIFLDRGTIGETDNSRDGFGVEFIKNYFA